jgi:predicted DNA repair protein MutK
VWAVAKGSLLNKAILVPSALAISAVAPWAVTPLLMIGGVYLCYEGFEKLVHKLLHGPAKDDAHHAELMRAWSDSTVDLVSFEKAKIKGAVRTDFILSAEIIVIALGVVANAPFATRVAVLVGIALAMTAGVYGLVAGIVKLDDAGRYLAGREGDAVVERVQRRIGASILAIAPWLMKILSIAGTAAMFLVGGGILVHGIPALHGWIEGPPKDAAGDVADMFRLAMSLLLDAVMGVVAGALALAVARGVQRVVRPRT